MHVCMYVCMYICVFRDYLGPRLQKDHPDLALIIYDHNRDHLHDFAKEILKDPDTGMYVCMCVYICVYEQYEQ